MRGPISKQMDKTSASPNPLRSRSKRPPTRIQPIAAARLGIDVLSSSGMPGDNLIPIPTGSSSCAPKIVHKVARLVGCVEYNHSATSGQHSRAKVANQFADIVRSRQWFLGL